MPLPRSASYTQPSARRMKHSSGWRKPISATRVGSSASGSASSVRTFAPIQGMPICCGAWEFRNRLHKERNDLWGRGDENGQSVLHQPAEESRVRSELDLSCGQHQSSIAEIGVSNELVSGQVNKRLAPEQCLLFCGQSVDRLIQV